MTKIKIVCFITIILGVVFPREISLTNKDASKTYLGIETVDLNHINDILTKESYIPVWSTFYQLDEGKDIVASFEYSNYTIEINNDDLLLDIINTSVFPIDSETNQFPENNLIISEPQVFRGIVVRKIMFIPFTYNLDTHEFKTFNDVEIIINDIDTELDFSYTDVKLSRAFEPLFEDIIVNYQPSSREEDYQVPSILYICGGSSISHPYVEDLIEWRHKRGYIVNVVSTGSIGGSGSTTIKNYIQNAYEEWENPPEIVGLIGDTGGSYSIGYFTDSWSGLVALEIFHTHN